MKKEIKGRKTGKKCPCSGCQGEIVDTGKEYVCLECGIVHAGLSREGFFMK